MNYRKEIRSFKEIVIRPVNEERKESSDFRKSKARLRKDGHYKCWICDEKDPSKLQVHHFGCQWSLASLCDLEKLKETLETFDIYGYSYLLRNQPIRSIDDIRNMMVLCSDHHNGSKSDGAANGIHYLTFPTWISQRVCRSQDNPVPKDQEELNRRLSK